MKNIGYIINKDLTPEENKMDSKPQFTKNDVVSSDKLIAFKNQINTIKEHWDNSTYYTDGYLVQVNFYTVISKSKRIQKLFPGDKRMCGSHFNYFVKNSKSIPKHSMVFLFKKEEEINTLISKIEVAIQIVNSKFYGKIDKSNYAEIEAGEFNNDCTKEYNISLALEFSRIESFSLPDNPDKVDKKSLVHFYTDPKKTLETLGIRYLKSSIFDNTVLLEKDDINKLLDEAPYFIASTYVEITSQPQTESKATDIPFPSLPKPKNEPVIGVFDTPFDMKCQLKDGWVESKDLRKIKSDDAMENFFHGTEVCSLLVCGNILNDNLGLDDHCGLFKVRHFAIANKEFTSTSEIMSNIKQVIEDKNNKDIKVWNISLGTIAEINKNFVSPVAALIDKLQAENPNIIFVVAGTNNNDLDNRSKENYRIGSPADSINSLVVNSVKFGRDEPASYTRKGGVLDFFIKPDVSYYGGDEGEELLAYNGLNVVKVSGTSFAAPLVTRKVAYLIYNLGFSRELAKALIVDSAAMWDREYKQKDYLGRGVVPVTIEDILSTDEDETKLVYTNEVVDYSSYDYTLPIPLNEKNNINFKARVTMVYFTPCKVEFGVDYTNIEVDLKFGSMKDGKIKSLIPNRQYEDSMIPEEKEARNVFSKWDNIKMIQSKNQKKFGDSWASSNRWGFNLHTIYRNENIERKYKYNFTFGIVITLKSLDGKNHSSAINKAIQDSDWKIKPIQIEYLNTLSSSLRSELMVEDNDDPSDE